MRFYYNLLIKIGFFYLIGCQPLCAAPGVEGIQVYQKNMHLSPQHRQHLAADMNRFYQAGTLWHALRQEFKLAHYENNPVVQEKIQWFLNHQDYLLHSMTRSAPYLYFILQQIKKRHLPAELVLLPIIESAYNPFALNVSSGAAGIWQMMPSTASGYGIKQNQWYDGRRDIIASTEAALNHLAYLQSFFNGNWLLAIAAYDTGEGNVLAAIRKNITNGENTDFWSLPVARETQDYVPRLLALAIIISHPEEYPIEYPPVRNAPYLAQVDVGSAMDLKAVASYAGLSFKELKQLNPGYSHSTMDPQGHFKLVLPIANVQQFTQNLAGTSFTAPPQLAQTNKPPLEEITTNTSAEDSSSQLSQTILEADQAFLKSMAENNEQHASYKLEPGDTLYMVRSGDDLHKIAQHFHVSPQVLASVNQFSQSKSLHPGESLIIPTHAKEEKSSAAQGDTIYRVKPGDTIEKIALKFHTTPEAVRLVNLLADNTLETGDQLIIPERV